MGAKKIRAESVFDVVYSLFGHPLRPHARRPICVLLTAEFSGRMSARPWAITVPSNEASQESTIINSPCIPQGPRYFFFYLSRLGETSGKSASNI